ncbi:MAG TPA: TROVE domain-containing protein [Micromonosporaceae bacterium]|jgi:60 kDa SS-A/Ro ribonucleoprotein|nr:TROVE domain-containing protein [Micromonosporaceae bacterium]
MPDALSAINLRSTPQSRAAERIQVPNNAGGFAFTVAPVERLRRFLVLGTDGGTYYASERALTKENAEVVLAWAGEQAAALVDEVVAISVAGRAPRNNAALFALAAAASLGDAEGRKAALAALPHVARTGTHLLLFAGYVEQFRGWGRGLRRAVSDWYVSKPVDAVAYQAVKYRQREGWSHRDLLRLAHPATDEPDRKQLFDWICGRSQTGPEVVEGFQRAQAATAVSEWVAILDRYPSLSWEMLPDAAVREAAVWAKLIDNGVPQTALMRQLPRLTRLGLLAPMSDALETVVGQLTDPERLSKARVHPVNILVAARTYASGGSARGQSAWEPIGQIVDALDAAFYAAFGAVQPAGKRTLLALDISGSMVVSISGLPISAREVSAALALVTAATEPKTTTVGFTASADAARTGLFTRDVPVDGISALSISPRQRLNDAVRAVSDLPFGRTDCALPMLWAKANKIKVDTFVVYTDNETWAGNVHPHQALRQYRDWSGINARLAVVGLTATDFTIADPNDPGTLDIAGFDSAVPTLLTDFSARVV